MANMEVSPRVLRLVKPTLDTPFHIDHSWWERNDRDLRVELRSHLCAEHRLVYADHYDTEVIDWVDPRTAEVSRVDGLHHVVREHCSRQADFIGAHLSLVDVVFRIFLANGNVPLTPRELARMTGRPAETILRTLGGRTVYKGLMPLAEG